MKSLGIVFSFIELLRFLLAPSKGLPQPNGWNLCVYYDGCFQAYILNIFLNILFFFHLDSSSIRAPIPLGWGGPLEGFSFDTFFFIELICFSFDLQP